MLRLPTALLCALLAPPAAQAVRIEGFATGLVAETAETDVNGEAVFGLDGPGLLGQAFRIDFAYDTSLAPPDADPDPGRAVHATSVPGSGWLELAIEINGHAVGLDGANRRAEVNDDIPVAASQEDWLQLSVEHFSNTLEGDVQQHRRTFLDFFAFMPPDTLSGDALPGPFFSDALIRVFNSAAFRINDFDYDGGAGEATYTRYVSFNLDIQQISAAPVPEPGSAVLLATGLAALAARRRRRSGLESRRRFVF